jgi:peptide/nickel transport system substrate-binding protein
MPNDQYWGKWTENDFGITEWYHRPLGTMVMNLAYINDADGKPVPWNETRWSDDEFAKLLKQANGTLDVDERRKIMCKLEDIQQERGSIGLAFWRNKWYTVNKKVKGIIPSPSLYMDFNEVWMDA